MGIQTALEEAIRVTSDCPYRRTFHSDQGWAYQMKSYTKRLKEERIFQSMSRKGNCLDNSVMENFFGLLKQEIYYGLLWSSVFVTRVSNKLMSNTSLRMAYDSRYKNAVVHGCMWYKQNAPLRDREIPHLDTHEDKFLRSSAY